MALKDVISTATTSTGGSDEEYIASRYDGLNAGPDLTYTFETQTGVPYDGTNRRARQLSPFTFRLVVPEILSDATATGVDVNLLGRAAQDANEKTSQANQIRAAAGISSVTSSSDPNQRLADLQAVYSSGQVLTTTLGETQRAVLTDLTTVADIRYQLEKMLQVPPLTLFVNPNSLSISYSAVQSFSNRSRYGFIFERWGEDQTTLSISGSTGSFAVGSNPLTATGSQTETSMATGVQFASKRDSAAYQQLVSLFQIFKNNGYIYDTLGHSQAHLMIGAVAIDYDQFTYIGNIESFEYTYNQDTPHRIEWSMEFTVGRMYDHAVAPVVVAPQSSPTPSVGSVTASELAQVASSTLTPTDPSRVLSVTGAEQFQRSEGQTPLQVVGSYLDPTGLF
jgi:hypothetical protein